MAKGSSSKGVDVARMQRQAAANDLANKAAKTLDTPKADASLEQRRGAGAKVTVGCKVPNGMLLRLFQMGTRQEPVMGGGLREFKQAEVIPGAPTVRVNGPAVPYGAMPNYTIAGGCGFTNNVDRDFWVKWLEQNKDHDAVLNGMIFAEDNEADAKAKALELKGELSGLHPIIPDSDKRIPKVSHPNLSNIATEEERAKKMASAA